jgi:hypothetical protein
MKTWRQRSTAVAAALLIVCAACSSGDSGDGSPAPGDEQATGEVGTATMDPGFETDSLPDDFPSELIPDSYTAGMYAELGTVRNVNFESPAGFDDVVAEYSDKIGEEPIIAQGEERLASWTVDIWVVSVIESEPIVIGVSTSE